MFLKKETESFGAFHGTAHHAQEPSLKTPAKFMVNVGQLPAVSSFKFKKALTVLLIQRNVAISHSCICEKFNRSQK